MFGGFFFVTLHAEMDSTLIHNSFVGDSAYYHPELPARWQGVDGNALPYRQINDTGVTGLILALSVITFIVMTMMRNFYFQQIHDFFAPNIKHQLSRLDISSELFLQMFLVLVGCISGGLTFFAYAQHTIGETYSTTPVYLIMGALVGEIVGMYLIKQFAYQWVNTTFFPECNIHLWNSNRLFLDSLTGVIALPVLIITNYTVYNPYFILISYVLLALVYEIMVFYKVYSIFFEKNAFKLQIFLYLCTLEILPALILVGMMLETTKVLILKF